MKTLKIQFSNDRYRVLYFKNEKLISGFSTKSRTGAENYVERYMQFFRDQNKDVVIVQNEITTPPPNNK